MISAPRRIGKTSILKHITRNPKDNQIIKYMIVQSADSGETFYKKVLNTLISDKEIYNLTKTLINRLSVSAKAYISKVKGIKLDGVEISGYETLDYYELVSKVFAELSKHKNQIVLIFDEFPDAVANIYGNNKKAAIVFLQQHREFRELFSNSSLLFIYTGSTGLKNVVRKVGEVHLINNLIDIKIPPFSKNEAKELIQRLVLSRQLEIQDFNINDKVIDYILEKVTWLLPYYIQIIIEEVFDNFNFESNEVTNQSVDEAINLILEYDSSYSEYFENWLTRLKTAFQDKVDLRLAIEILNHIAIENTIRKSQLHDLLVKHKKSDGKYVVDVLRFDGYIDFNEESLLYGFNSFLLKKWWYINVAT